MVASVTHTRMFTLKESNVCCVKFKKHLLFVVLLHYTRLTISQFKGLSSLLLAFWEMDKMIFLNV